MSSNQQKADTLGMPHGTAANRLRKSIILYLLIRLGEADCYRCGNTIENTDDLSIEHKKPWEGRENGAELFFDLDNVAFSHMQCNRPHIKHGGSFRKGKRQLVGPPATKWCPQCCRWRDEDTEFTKNRGRYDGLEPWCKHCRSRLRSSEEERRPVTPEGEVS